MKYSEFMKELNLKQISCAIKFLRKKNNISQNYLAQALNIPRSSVSQIENEARDLSFIEFQKILNLFQISFDEFIQSGIPKLPMNTKKNSNKKIIFDKKRFKELFMYVLQKCSNKPNVGETVLYKLLYFCDFNYFELYEKPLTGMKYKKMQFGPVPDQILFNKVLEEMRKAGMIERVARPYIYNTIQTRYINFVEADLSIFGDDLIKMIKVVDDVIERFSNMSARQIEACSHRDYPWQSHNMNDEIEYSSVFSRSEEFANRDYNEMLQQSAANDIIDELGKINDEEYSYYSNLLSQ